MQKSLDLPLTLLTQPALDQSKVVQHYVFVHADGVEVHLNNISQPDHLWVAYLGTLVYVINFIMSGKHAFKLAYNQMSYAMPGIAGVADQGHSITHNVAGLGSLSTCSPCSLRLLLIMCL